MRVLGGWSYRLAGLDALLRWGSRLERVAVETPALIGAATPVLMLGAFVTNTTLLGGGMNVPIESDMADGRIEIACIDAISRVRLHWAFLCLANGWRVPDGVLRVVRTDRAVITCDRPLPFAADGELVCEDARFDIAVRQGALNVVC